MGTVSAPETVERLLARAAELGASDLHLTPQHDGLRVRVRRDGVLLDLETLPAEQAPRIVGRLKALADLLAYRTDVPQEGRIDAARSPVGAALRVATYPTVHGERVALRFDTHEAAPGLEGLGLPGEVLASLTAALSQPDGVILLTGPSGSGKTTTVYAALRHLAAALPARSIMTLEDPVERRVEGVDQTEVNRAAGLDFARALRSLLRQDPEVILVGEIRDRETAAIALEAGLTGHLVISTVHAGTAPNVFARLLEMDVEPFVLTTAVRGVLAQRLLRKTCDDCAGTGCALCADTGHKGRVLAAEWLAPDAAFRAAVLARSDGDTLAAAARASGVTTLRDAVDTLVRDGRTTSEEAQRVLGRD